MSKRMARLHTVVGLADRPTPVRRLAAAMVAAPLAFLLTYGLLGVVAEWGSAATFFAAIACAVAAGVAAATLRWAMAVAYGLLAALWVLAEALVAALGALAAGLG